MRYRALNVFVVLAMLATNQPGAVAVIQTGAAAQPAVDDALPFGLTNTPAALVPYDEAMRQLAVQHATSSALPGAAGMDAGALLAGAGLEATPREIVDLARALKNDPDLFFEFVHNRFVTLPVYGSLKGPLGTLLDGSGTAFDQAELLYQLLRVAGYEASFQIGQIQLSAAQLTNWLGTDSSPSATARVLARGGIAGVVSPTPAGTLDHATIAWAWVTVKIDNVEYAFDPATKSYDRPVLPTPLNTILQYNRSTFLSAAMSGATITSTTVSGINRTALQANLTALANNLKAYLTSNGALLSAEAVVGGKTIRRLALNTRLRETSLPYAVGTQVTEATMPDQFRTVLRVSLPGTNTIKNIFSSDLYGRSVTIFFDSSLQPTLRVDGALTAGSGSTGVAYPAGSQVPIAIGVHHPYPSAGLTCRMTVLAKAGNSLVPVNVDYPNVSAANQCGTLTVQAGSAASPGRFALLAGFGGAGRGMIEKRRVMLDEAGVDNDPASVAVLGESLSMQGYDWLAQLTRLAEMSDGMLGTSTVFHHAVGIVGIRAVGSSVGPYLDLPMVKAGFAQRTDDPGVAAGSTPRETSALFAAAGWLSVLESGVIEQTQPTHTAVSTTSILNHVLPSDVIYDINNASVPGSTPSSYHSSIRPQMAKTYPAADLARIDALVAAGRRVIAPRIGSVSIEQWTGVGYFSIAQGSAEASIGALITGGMSGGFVTRPIPIPAFNINSLFTFVPDAKTFTNTIAGISRGGNAAWLPIGGDPVNLPTGHYLYDVTDLKTGGGEFPLALEFIRSYDSGRGLRKGCLGHGWSHNFEARAQRDSDGFEGLGLNSPVSGVAAIVAVYVVQDLMNSVAAKPLERILVAAGIQQWALDNMADNVVTVTQPGNSEHFVRLPDGTYNPPLGSASSLAENSGGGYTYKAKDQGTLIFDAEGRLTSFAPLSGPTVNLTYNGSSRLTVVANTLGRRLTFSYSGDLLAGVSDDAGRSVAFAYDSDQNLSTASDAAGKVTTYTYSKRGQLRQIFYPSHPTTAYITNDYDSERRVTTQVDARGQRTESFFAGSRTEIVNPAGKSRIYYFTPRGQTLSDTDEAGQTTFTQHDHHDRVVRTTMPAGDSIAYTYDPRHNVLSITRQPPPGSLAPASVKTFTYHPTTNKVLSETDENGQTTTMTYDERGNLLSRVDPQGHVEKMTYNAAGFVTTVTDALDRTIDRVYDSAGNLVLVTDALKRSTAYTYDSAGRRLTMTDARGNTWRYTYDSQNNLVSTTDPLGNVVTNVHDASNRLVSVTNPRGFRRTLEYDASGLLLREVDAKGGVTEHAYNALSQRIRTTDPRGKQTIFGFSANGRQTHVTNANGHLSQTVFDDNGHVVSSVDPKGRETRFTNNFLGQPIEIRNALGRTVTKTYDPKGRVTSEVDEFGNATTFTHDPAGRVTRITDAAGRTVILEYDAAGNRISQRDRNERLSVATHDAQNRLQSVSNPLGQTTTWTWDEVGNRIARTDALGRTVTYTYDSANRLVGVTYPDGSAVRFTLDANGNVTQMVDALGTSRYVYDELDRVTSYTDPFGKQIGYGYDANGNLISLSYPDGKVVTYEYDAGNRMASVTDWTGRVISLSHDSTDLLTGVQFPNGTATALVFDGADQPVSRADTPGISAYSLTRDSTVRRLSINSQQPLAATPVAAARTSAVNQADQLVDVNGVPYVVDANGNNTRRGSGSGQTVSVYNFENRLVANGTVRYDYDGLGVRLQTTNGATTTRYVVDARNDLTQVLCETDGAGAITRYYIYGPGLLAAVTPNDDAFYYHFDPTGSTIAITNGAGRVVNKYAYDPFGSILDSVEEVGNPFAFSGRFGLMKEANGLVYARARFYDPSTGRFMTSDPSRNGLDGQLNGNLFVYGDGDPVTGGDPLGLYTVQLDNYLRAVRNSLGKKAHSYNSQNREISYEEALATGKAEPYGRAKAHGEGTVKFTFPDGSEQVYRNRQRVTDPEIMGTYNRGGKLGSQLSAWTKAVTGWSFYDGATSFINDVEHGILDVVPYVAFGTSPDDPSHWYERAWWFGPQQGVQAVGGVWDETARAYRTTWTNVTQLGLGILSAWSSGSGGGKK